MRNLDLTEGVVGGCEVPLVRVFILLRVGKGIDHAAL